MVHQNKKNANYKQPRVWHVFKTTLIIMFILGAFIHSYAQPAFENETKVVNAILAEKVNWQKVYDLLSGVTPETSSPVARMIKGHACLALNRNNESFRFFSNFFSAEQLTEWKDWTNKLIDSNRNNAIVYYLVGDAEARIGNFDLALTSFHKGLEISKDHYLILNARGCLFASNNQLDNALRDFYKVTKVNPAFADGHSNLGAIWILRKAAPQTALESFNKALEISPNYVVALNGKACVNFALGHFEETISDLGYVSKLANWYNTPLFNMSFFTQLKKELTSNLAQVKRKIQPGTSIEAINSYASSLNDKEARLEIAYSKGHVKYNQVFKNLMNTLDANLPPENLRYYNTILLLKNDIQLLVNELNAANPELQPTIQKSIDLKLDQMEQNVKQLFSNQLDKSQINSMLLSLMKIPEGIKIGIQIGGFLIGILFGDPIIGTGEAIGVTYEETVKGGKEEDEQGESGDSGKDNEKDKDKEKNEQSEGEDNQGGDANTDNNKGNTTKSKTALNKNFMLINGINGLRIIEIPPWWWWIDVYPVPPEQSWEDWIDVYPVPPEPPLFIASIHLNKLYNDLEVEERFWSTYQQSILKSHSTIEPEGVESVDIINAFVDKGIWLAADLSLNYHNQQ